MAMASSTTLTGIERFFEPDEIIVSKTDLKGCITYANQLFERISGFTEPELIGKNHNLIRHPEMPRCVFKFLWDTLQARKEIFAYVVNRCKNGDHYWVFAHVTPSFDNAGRIVGYHSNRRVPTREALDQIMPIYAELLREEKKYSNPRKQWEASLPLLVAKLEGLGITYDELMFTLCV
jgi:PAS domain S-box-containing protein